MTATTAAPPTLGADQPVRSVFGTVWRVTEQIRTTDQGDIDAFENIRRADEDWITFSDHARLNLTSVKTVWLTFGTINDPNYLAKLTGFDGRTLSLNGVHVERLQDELLRRVPRQ